MSFMCSHMMIRPRLQDLCSWICHCLKQKWGINLEPHIGDLLFGFQSNPFSVPKINSFFGCHTWGFELQEAPGRYRLGGFHKCHPTKNIYSSSLPPHRSAKSDPTLKPPKTTLPGVIFGFHDFGQVSGCGSPIQPSDPRVCCQKLFRWHAA